MRYKEFKEKYMGGDSKWDFNKFKITCLKCDSDCVEFNGYLSSDAGYYAGESELNAKIIIKCHSCGNAHVIVNTDTNWESSVELNKDGEKCEADET